MSRGRPSSRRLSTSNPKPEKKYYVLEMFPYPSGDKLHLGHWMSYVPPDAWARFRRMQGRNVFMPAIR